MAFIYFSMLMLVLALPILYFFSRTKILAAEKEKQLVAFKASQEAEEKQRANISAILHDQVIAELTVIVQNYELSIRAYEQNKFNIDDLREDKLVAIKSIESVREVALELIPQELLRYGLVAALNSHLKKQKLGFSASLENRSRYQNELPFNKSKEVSIYRLSLEIITNLRKHDNATKLKVEMESAHDLLCIKFLHDGRGISDSEISQLEKSANGLGLKSIQSRLITLEASINYVQSKVGSAIIVKIPIT